MAANPSYAPSFTVLIGGSPLPTAMRAAITTMRYQDGLEGADRVELTIANDRLQWLDDPILHTDNRLELRLGYAPDPLETVFVGEITGVEASFAAGGIPTLQVVAHDFLQRLTIGTHDREFAVSIPGVGKFPLPDQVVASLVGASNLLIPVVDPVGAALSFLTLLVAYATDPIEAKAAVATQKGQSDFDLLTGLARNNGWEMSIDHTLEPKGYVLHFQFLAADLIPSAVLRWGRSLIDFTPRLSTVGQVAAVETRIWISAIKQELVVVLGWNFDRAGFDLQVREGGGDVGSGQEPTATLRIDALGPTDAPKKIMSELVPRLNNRLTASGTTIGNPALKASRVVALEGVGQQFGGLYRLTSATHTIDNGGYRTAFEARKEVWFGSIPLPTGAGGLVRVQGQAIG